MTTPDPKLQPFRRFRIAAVRYSLVLTAVFAGVASIWGQAAIQGVLMGGIAGILGFWFMARQLEKLALTNPGKVHSSVLTWSMIRLFLYGAVLYKAFTLDEARYTGLLGAIAGIFVIRIVLIGLGVTGIDLAADNRANADEGHPGSSAE